MVSRREMRNAIVERLAAQTIAVILTASLKTTPNATTRLMSVVKHARYLRLEFHVDLAMTFARQHPCVQAKTAHVPNQHSNRMELAVF